MTRLYTWLKKSPWTFPSILLLVVGLLFVTNHVPGTYLMGWDSIQTDLNPGLGVKRAFFSVWEEYQSFGLLAGMGHGADLIRAVGVWIVSLVVPGSLIRYFFQFGVIALGALGVYVVLHELTKKSSWVAFIGALFYILNYGTVQIMSVPLESFSIFFGFLPWLIWSFVSYVHSSKMWDRWFWIFVIVNVVAAPLAYVQTMFIVYGLVLSALFVGELLRKGKRLHVVRKSVIAAVVIVILNLNWLLPQVYFVLSGGVETVRSAKINQLSTENVAMQNRESGSLSSFVQMRGFYSQLDNSDRSALFEPWNNRFAYPLLSGVLFVVMILGLVQKSPYRLGMGLLFGLCAAVWMLPVADFAGQIFRSPFTKFITVYSLVASYFFACGIEKFLSRKWVIGLVLGVLLFTALPAFRGHYFASDMQVQIPQEYLDTIEYFKTVDANQRIALMPEYTFWGWFFTDWGYNGSGFLWYGIEQPIVSRTFDVWSASSESYFWEMKAALEAEDVLQMEEILEKYAIDYIVVDHSLRPVSSGVRALQYDRLAQMLSQSSRVRQFGFGEKLSLYTFERSTNDVPVARDFVSLAGHLPSVGPDVPYLPADVKDITVPYVSAALPDRFYPFRSLFSQTRLADDQWALKEYEKSFVAIGRTPSQETYTLEAPMHEMQAQLYKDGQTQTYAAALAFEMNAADKTLAVTIPKTLVQSLKPSDGIIHDCSRKGRTLQKTDTQIEPVGNGLRIASYKGATPCITYEFPYLNQRYGYLITIKNRNIEGQHLFMSLTDNTKDQPHIEDRLRNNQEMFIVAPRYMYGQGYTLTFQNTSYQGIPSINLLEDMNIYVFPYEALHELHLHKDTPAQAGAPLQAPKSVQKRAYHAYTIDLTAKELASSEYVVLHQSFHPGWKAFVVAHDRVSQYAPLIAGRALPETDHVRINGWAQGWRLPETCEKGRTDCRLVLLFWPQYLQWLGFGVLAGMIALMIAHVWHKH